MEQLFGVERLADEHHAISGEEIAQNTRMLVLLRVMPQHLRQHVQLTMDESTTYSELREKLLSFERATASHSSLAVYTEFVGGRDDKQQHDDVGPMDVDRIEGKTKAKQKVRAKETRAKTKAKAMAPATLRMTRAKEKERAPKALKVARMERVRGDCHRMFASFVVAKGIGVENAPSATTASTASKQSSATKSDTNVTTRTVQRIETMVLDLDEEDEAEEAEVRMVSEAYDLTYTDEDTDWVIFTDERWKKIVKPGSRTRTTWTWLVMAQGCQNDAS